MANKVLKLNSEANLRLVDNGDGTYSFSVSGGSGGGGGGAGDASAANQVIGNTSLATIATQTNVSKGAGTTDATTVRVVLPTDTPAIPSFGPDITLAATVASGGTGAALAAKGNAGFGLNILGTWTGTVTVEQSTDGGTTWTVASIAPLGGGLRTSSITANGQYEGITAGTTHIRVQGTGVLTGSVNYSLVVTRNSRITRVWSTSAANMLVSSWLSDANGTAIVAGTTLRSTSLPVVQADATITRCSFADTGAGLVTTDMTQLGTTGSGMTVNQSGGNLVVTTGATVNSEFLARSNVSVSGAFARRLKFNMSQRIVNQNLSFYMADIVGEGLAFTTDATGLILTVTKTAHGYTSKNVGQAIFVGGFTGIAASAPGRMVITGIVDANTFTISPAFSCTWTRSTTTATVTFVGGAPIFAIAENATVSASSDTAAIVNGVVSLLTFTTGGVTTFNCLNAGATSGTLTLTMTSKALTASSSGTLCAWGMNNYHDLISGTATGQLAFDANRRGWGSGATVQTNMSTSAAPGPLLHLQSDATYCAESSRTSVSSTTQVMAQIADRVENIPNDDVQLYLFIQVLNGTTAPASTTTINIGMWSLEKLGNNKVHIAGSTQNATGHSLMAKITEAISITGNVTVTATNLQSNINQIAGATPITTSPNGATNKAIAAMLGTANTNTDYSAQAWAAATGSGATIADTSGDGVSTGYDVSVTAVTLGSAVGMWVFLQESMDNGTTWKDIWQTELISTVSHTYIPAIPICGRRRMRWVNINATGTATAATTMTVTVTAMKTSGQAPKQVQWFDRTNNLTAGTVTGTGVSSSVYNIEGCKAFTFYVRNGTITTGATIKVQFSMDGTNFYDASAAVTMVASSLTLIPITAGIVGRFAKFISVTAGTANLVTDAGIYATN